MELFKCLLSVVLSISCWLTVSAADVYVDAEHGSDTEHGGTSPTDAYQSLTKAMTGLASGSTVHAAAGTYAAESAEAPDGYRSRVVVPTGVTLVADGEGEAIIQGETGMRCVWLEAGATLKGFTVRGGYITDTTDQKHYGAGVASAATSAAARHLAFVEDCLITENKTDYRGAAVSCVVVRRCRILNNTAAAHGSAAIYGKLYNTIVDNNTSGNATCYQTLEAVNCTFGPGNNQRGFHKAAVTCKNCIFLGIMIDDGDGNTFKFDHCAFAFDAPGMAVTEAHIGVGSYRVPAAQIQLTDDYTPVAGACVAVDAGDNAVVDGATDVYGRARIYNGTVDMGAVEAGAGLTIAADDGGIAVTGATIGRTALSDTPITVTLTRTFDSAYGCCGFLFNGELVRFGEGEVGESWTHAFSAADGSASLVAVYEKVWYVDAATNLADGQTHDGRSKARAYKTLAAAMANPSLVAGDEVRALPGTYETDTMPSADGVEARVAVKAGVLLAAAGSAEETVIRGGTDIRGVWLETGATVRGFTIRDANIVTSQADGKNVYGGGVSMQDGSTTRNRAFVEDCRIVGNKVAYRGGGIANVVVRRSLILDNEGVNHAAAAYYGALYDCVIDGHLNAQACTQNTTPIVNCTFGPRNTQRAITKIANIFVTNTLFMSEFQPGFVTPGYVTVDHCLFATNNANGTIVSAAADTLVGTGSRLADYREVKLRANYAIGRNSVAVDAGNSSAASEKDVFGNPRVMGAAVDVGAAEFDPASGGGMKIIYR